MRGSSKWPLLAAMALPVLFAGFGTALVGGSGLGWYEGLRNYAFFGLRSTLAGFLGILVFLAPLTALAVVLPRHERFSAGLLVPYYAWVLYDLACNYQL